MLPHPRANCGSCGPAQRSFACAVVHYLTVAGVVGRDGIGIAFTGCLGGVARGHLTGGEVRARRRDALFELDDVKTRGLVLLVLHNDLLLLKIRSLGSVPPTRAAIPLPSTG